MAKKINIVSERVTQPRAQGASQAMLHATGLTSEDLNKAQVGIDRNPLRHHAPVPFVLKMIRLPSRFGR